MSWRRLFQSDGFTANAWIPLLEEGASPSHQTVHPGSASPAQWIRSRTASLLELIPTAPTEPTPAPFIAYDDFTTIDWIHDLSRERQRLAQLKTASSKTLDALQTGVLVTGMAVLIGLLAAFISISSEWLSDLKNGYCEKTWYLNQKFCCWMTPKCDDWRAWHQLVPVFMAPLFSYVVYVSMAVLLAWTSALLCQSFAPYAAGSGIPEIKTVLSGYVIHGLLSGRTLLIKSIALVLAVASGLTLGKEGPMVHVALCCCHFVLVRVLKFRQNEAKKREILSAAAAAGVSVAFGAPIAGVLFSLEEVSYFFPSSTMWRSFYCAMLSTVTLQLWNPLRTGKLVLFQTSYDQLWHVWELIPFAIVGALGGVYGAWFIQWNLRVQQWRRSMGGQFAMREVCWMALLTALISYLNAFMRLDATQLLAILFRECDATNDDELGLCGNELTWVIISLVLCTILKAILATVTYGISVPAGIFVPSMVVGACLGRLMGMAIQAVVGESTSPGTYAMMGAAAALGGVTRMTLTVAVMMFELTGALSYVLPCMIALIMSRLVGDALQSEAHAEAMISLKGYPYLSDALLKPTPQITSSPSKIMTPVQHLVCIPHQGQTIASLLQLLETKAFKAFPIIETTVDKNNNPLLLGIINRGDLKNALALAQRKLNVDLQSPCLFSTFQSNISLVSNSIDLTRYVNQTPLCLDDQAPLDLILETFKKLGLRIVPVVKWGRLVGVMTKKDVLRYLSKS